MLNHIDHASNIKYTFIPNTDWHENIKKNECTFSNDVHKKYNASLNISGELIVCEDLKKINEFCKKITQETFQEYEEIISKRDPKKDQWVYNILNGVSEQNKILHRDKQIVIIPNYTWNSDDINKMHILTFPLDKNLRSIRSLTGEHVELLTRCKLKTLEIIKNTYGFDQEQIKMFFHYAPQTYHLHIHSVLISNVDCHSSVEYSHELSNVIFNLNIKSDYYKSCKMNKRN